MVHHSLQLFCRFTAQKQQIKLLHVETYPRDDQLPSEVLNLSLDFAADVELVTVQGDALQVGQQVGLAGGVGALQQRETEKPLLINYGHRLAS